MLEGLDKLNRLAKEFSRLESVLPTKLGNIAVNFFKDSFQRQGFIEKNRVEKWKPRKEWPGMKGRSRGKQRALLVKTGRLRRSIRVTQKGKGFVIVGTDVPYARAHNEGGEIKQTVNITAKMRKFFWARFYDTGDTMWKHLALKRTPIKRTINMPERKFMGLSEFLERRLEKNMEHEIEQIFRKIL